MKAFDAASGTLLWSVNLPDRSAFTSAPTAVNGTVFIGGAGIGGTVYAVDETNGAVLWTMPVENGDHSSPAVTGGNVYVSYACPQSYAFNAVTGQRLWEHDSCCQGGGGATPVVVVSEYTSVMIFVTRQPVSCWMPIHRKPDWRIRLPSATGFHWQSRFVLQQPDSCWS